MKSTTEKPGPQPEDVLAELRELVAEAEKILAREDGGESAAGASGLEALRARLEAARDRLFARGETMRRKAKAGVRRADDAIRENPYQAIAIAAGLGLVLGMLLNHRRD